MEITPQLIKKINQLKNDNYIPLKLQFNESTYIKILEECNFIKKENGEYIWYSPKLVETSSNTPGVNTFFGLPFVIEDEGFDWAIVSEEKSNG